MNKRQKKKADKKDAEKERIENLRIINASPFVLFKMLSQQPFTDEDAKVMQRISEETCE